MIYMANPTTVRAREAMTAGLLGAIISPRQGNRLPDDVLFCIDNNCGPDKTGRAGTGYPGDEKYLHLLRLWAEQDGADPYDPFTSRCLFVAAPDVLGDAAATLKRSEYFLPLIREIANLPAALVAQDGLENLTVPWDEFDCLFIGGSTEWKLGPAARALVAEAKVRRKWAHMGRVNTRQRLRYAHAIGCDSADGTGMTRAPDVLLAQMLAWLREIDHQFTLWDAA